MIFRVNRKLKERQLGCSGEKVVTANSVMGGSLEISLVRASVL